MSDKFCVNCKHCTAAFGNSYSCIIPEIAKDLVTGRVYSYSCKDARYNNSFCGHDANWFEPKETAKEESK